MQRPQSGRPPKGRGKSRINRKHNLLSLFDIPESVLEYVGTFLDYRSVLQGMLACRSLHEILTSDVVWVVQLSVLKIVDRRRHKAPGIFRYVHAVMTKRAAAKVRLQLVLHNNSNQTFSTREYLESFSNLEIALRPVTGFGRRLVSWSYALNCGSTKSDGRFATAPARAQLETILHPLQVIW